MLVTVDGTQGSVPREAGAWMAVFADTVAGTVGGGHLEFDAIAQARQLLPAAVLGAAANAGFALLAHGLGEGLAWRFVVGLAAATRSFPPRCRRTSVANIPTRCRLPWRVLRQAAR